MQQGYRKQVRFLFVFSFVNAMHIHANPLDAFFQQDILRISKKIYEKINQYSPEFCPAVLLNAIFPLFPISHLNGS